MAVRGIVFALLHLFVIGVSGEEEVLLEPSEPILDHLIKEIGGATPPPPQRDPNRWPLSLINSSQYWNLDSVPAAGSVGDAGRASAWLKGYLQEAQNIFHIAASAGWTYFTNITHGHREELVDAEEVLGRFLKASSAQARQFDLVALSGNASLARLLRMQGMEGLTALPRPDFQELSNLQRELAQNFTSGAVCEEGQAPPCALNWPAMQGLMATSRDPPTLRKAWLAWHDTVGPQARNAYARILQLSNKGANMNGFRDAGELWRSPFEEHSPSSGQDPLLSLQAELERLWTQIRPLYQQLHAFVRRKLAALYAPSALGEFSRDGPIPAHFLGSMAGDSWLALFADMAPFPRLHPAFAPQPEQRPPQPPLNPHSPFADPFAPPPDPLTHSLYEKEYTPTKMFKDAEALFTSMGFPALADSFWQKSVLEHPFTRDVFCHPPTAFDLKDGKNFLVKMCAEVSRQDFVEAHRLLAHSFYQRAYGKQPLTFREGANPAMSQALANAIGKYAASEHYLSSLGLHSSQAAQPEPEPEPSSEPHSKRTAELSDSAKRRINDLMEEALEWLVSGAYALSVDAWRWAAFDGSVATEALNGGWWERRRRYQGIAPPSPRSEDAFDPASTPHVATQQFPAVRRFLSYVLHFQILKGLCSAAGAKGALDLANCPLKGSGEAGRRLQRFMEAGISRPWNQILKELTGSEHLDATPLLEYYAPLMEWLKAKNAETGEAMGWSGAGSPFGSDILDGAPAPLGDRRGDGGVGGEVAFPGDACAEGQLCLLESVCNGTACVCREGFFAFHDRDPESGDVSTHCVEAGPEDFPEVFTNGGFEGGLEIAGEETVETTTFRALPKAATQLAPNFLPSLAAAFLAFLLVWR